MEFKERLFIILALLAIAGFSLFDLIEDLDEGVTIWHVAIEGSVFIISAIAVFILLMGTFKLKQQLANATQFSQSLREENQKYKQLSKKYVTGLAETIDEQLSNWQLTKAEKEVAFMLIKGLSLKEIAEFRGTTEKTARTQSTAIYAKAGVTSRSQLSAFFLEDLFLPG
ncbi:MAG: hypothetical protein CME65_15660 [Halobacteriovoraceae bacterium]|nr:hypothetical protein [Halobacteriovoraceae bacterium]|tara:strand:- start:2626 stop:3132 length:507 start_codon:yes stop_codon:yes gene_type:complete